MCDTTSPTSSSGRTVSPGDPEWKAMHQTDRPWPGEIYVADVLLELSTALADLDSIEHDLDRWIMTHSFDERKAKEVALSTAKHARHMVEEALAYATVFLKGAYHMEDC
jgi:hypothetical protein